MINKDEKKYHCSRCGRADVIDYDDYFDCIQCQLEFEKEDLQLYDEEDILSVEEKLKIIKNLEEK